MNEFELDEPPTFPPLFHEEVAGTGVDPFTKAISSATIGCNPGLIIHQIESHRLRAAIVLAPETSLENAMAMVFATSQGFADALGALAPPEVGVHFDWPADLRVNGARCGKFMLRPRTQRQIRSPTGW